jgi:hypothetical protein
MLYERSEQFHVELSVLGIDTYIHVDWEVMDR